MSSNVETIEEQIKTVKAYIPLDDSFNNTAVKRLQKLEVALEFAKKAAIELLCYVMKSSSMANTLLHSKQEVESKRQA